MPSRPEPRTRRPAHDPKRRVGVVVAVHNAHDALAACLASIARHTRAGVPVVLVDDASTDPRIAGLLSRFARRRAGTSIVARARNGGFAVAINEGIAALPATSDAVVLNADTVVTPGWLDSLQAAIAAAPDAGIACPLSNNATILSAPEFARPGPLPPGTSADDIAAILGTLPVTGPPVHLPTAVGFCMYITRRAWQAAGPLDPAFARGYGEECDLSMRVWASGLSVIAATGAFVYHAGSASFGESLATQARRQLAEGVLDARWPGYRSAIAAFRFHNPLRARLEALRVRLGGPDAAARIRIAHVVHRWGDTGGVENHVQELAAAHPGFDHVVIVPDPAHPGDDWREPDPASAPRVIGIPVAGLGGPPASFALLDDADALARLLRALRALAVQVVHVHHFLGWNGFRAVPAIRSAGWPVVLTLHDYLLLCPNYNFARSHGIACEKRRFDADDPECRECLPAFLGVRDHQIVDRLGLRRHATEAHAAIAAADRVLVPSEYARRRFVAGLPATLASRLEVRGFGDPAPPAPAIAARGASSHQAAPPEALQVAFLGSFSFAKGGDIFLAAARRLTGKGLYLSVVGPVDPAYLPALAELGIPASGGYRRTELAGLLSGIDVICILSRWEETYGFTLDEALGSRSVVVATDVGALAERARGRPGVVLIPPSNHEALIAALQTIDESIREQAAARQFDPRRWVAREALLGLYRELAPRSPTADAELTAPAIEAANAALRARLPAATAPTIPALGEPAYARWLAAQDAGLGNRPQTRASPARAEPVLHILLLAGGEEAWLELSLGSLRAIGGAAIVTLVSPRRPAAMRSSGIAEWRRAAGDLEAAAAVNAAVSESASRWVALLRAGDRVHPDALARLAAATSERAPPVVAEFFDDDLATLRGERYSPRFKPGYDPDFFATRPDLLDGLCAFRRDALLSAGGFASTDVECNFRLALSLARVHGPLAIRRAPRIGVHRLDARVIAWRLALALQAPGALAAADPLAGLAPVPPLPRPAKIARVRCVLWLDAGGGSARRAIAALLAQTGVKVTAIEPWCPGDRSTRPLVDPPAPQPRVSPLRRADSLADALNAASAHLDEEFLLVASERALPQSGGVLDLLARSCRDRVALACPRLLGPDRSLFAGGAVAGGGPDGVVGLCGTGRDARAGGPLLSLLLSRRVGMVAEDFVVIDRRALAPDHGFDAKAGRFFALAGFCLRARERGWEAWYEAAAVVQLAAIAPVADDADQRRRAQHRAEVDHMLDRWGPVLADDPCHNPNRPLRDPTGTLDPDLVVPWTGMPAPTGRRVIAAPFDAWGSGQYRVRLPLAHLAAAGRLEYALLPDHDRGYMPTVTELRRAGADTLYAHHPFHDVHLEALVAYRRHTRIRIVVGVDDRLDRLPAYNPYARTIYPDIGARIARALSLCDLLVTSTDALAAVYGDLAPETRVIPNALADAGWLRTSAPRPSALPRGGWAGARQHEGDLALIAPAVLATKDRARWVFLGMRPPGVPEDAYEFHAMVPFDQYPRKLASLGLDLGVAPLAKNDFNDAKSALRVLEYGALGIPALCSDVLPYRATPCTRVAAGADDWVAAVRGKLADRAALADEGRRLHRWVVRHGSLTRLRRSWLEALFGVGSTRRAVGAPGAERGRR